MIVGGLVIFCVVDGVCGGGSGCIVVGVGVVVVGVVICVVMCVWL